MNLWGYQIPKDSKDAPEPLIWFKLLLQENESFMNSSSDENFGAIENYSSSAVQSLDSMFGRLKVSLGRPAPSTPLEGTASTLKKLGLKPREVMSDFLKGVRDYIVKCI